MADAITHVGHKPSMLQDVLAGRPTEIEFINGAVVAAAVTFGVPCALHAHATADRAVGSGTPNLSDASRSIKHFPFLN